MVCYQSKGGQIRLATTETVDIGKMPTKLKEIVANCHFLFWSCSCFSFFYKEVVDFCFVVEGGRKFQNLSGVCGLGCNRF